MKAEFYLNFRAKKAYGGLALAGSPKASTKKPSTGHDEVCVKMCIEIPDILFQKPILEIKGKIDCDMPLESHILIASEAKSLIEKKLGLRCEIKE